MPSCHACHVKHGAGALLPHPTPLTTSPLTAASMPSLLMALAPCPLPPGGPSEAFARLQPLMELMGANVFHCGDQVGLRLN